MKKILIYVLLLNSNHVFSQSLDYSISPFLSFSNENLKNSYGLQIGTEYIQLETYGLKLSAGLFSPDNSTEDVFLIHMPTTITWLDLAVKIYPSKSYFSPYFGVGVGKYFISREWDGNAHGIEGRDILNGDLENNFGYHLILGSKLYKSIWNLSI